MKGLTVVIISFLLQCAYGYAQTDSVSYLALGDSYTVGRGVATLQTFPYQLADKLRSKKINVATPVLIAQNGYRTDELIKRIAQSNTTQTFDFVTLLIGVNNQFQNKSQDVYQTEFTRLLTTAVKFAKGNPKHVFVLSIPDWGVTPFANGRNPERIAAEIDQYNAINKSISTAAGVSYIDITGLSRGAADDPEAVTTDKLHPSAKMYGWWVKKISAAVAKEFKP
ncbi:SGNH/GDSL hydrolase family protein [Inquilinus sp. KBS0705]|nr:SGNH/GDSL hydrolase family protein [Inquilinus sp. KBS0705]